MQAEIKASCVTDRPIIIKRAVTCAVIFMCGHKARENASRPAVV